MANYPTYDFTASAGYDLITVTEALTSQFGYDTTELHQIKGFGRLLIEDARAISPFTQLRGSMKSMSDTVDMAPPILVSDELRDGGATFRIAYEHIDTTAPYKIPHDSHGKEAKDAYEHQDFTVLGWRKVRMTHLYELQITLINLLKRMKGNSKRNFQYFSDVLDLSTFLGVDYVDPLGNALYSSLNNYALNQIVAGNHSNVGQLDSDDYLSSDEILTAIAMGAAGEKDDDNEINFFRSPVMGGRKYKGILILHTYGADQLYRYDQTFREAMKDAAPRSYDTNWYFTGLAAQFEWAGVLVMILEKDLGTFLQFDTTGYKSGLYYDAGTGTTYSGKIMDPAGGGYAPLCAGCTAIYMGGAAFAALDGKFSFPVFPERYDLIFPRVHTMNIEGRGVMKSACMRHASDTASQNFVLIHHAGGSPNTVVS